MHTELQIHAVKEAGVADTLRSAGRFLFDEHNLPPYTPTHPGQQTPNWFDKINPLGHDKGVQPGYNPNTPNWFDRNNPLSRHSSSQRYSNGADNWFDRLNLRRAAPAYQPEMGPHSIISHPTLGYGEGFVNKAKTVGHSVGEFVRENTFGSPLVVDRQLHADTLGGVARNYGQLTKNFYGMGPGSSKFMTAMSLAQPAWALGSAITGDPNQRGANIGATLGGIAAAPVTSRLGIPGMFLQQPVQQLGSWIGSKFDPKKEPEKVASLIGTIADAAKKHPVSAAVAAATTLHGVNKLIKKPEPTNITPTLPSRST